MGGHDTHGGRAGDGMTSDDIPEALVHFIEEHVTSLEQLEVLFLLRKTAPREWTAAEVSRELGSSVMSIEGRLALLSHMRFVAPRTAERGPGFRYAPTTEEAAALIDAVAKLYKERRLMVIDLIYGRPESDIRAFSEAFMIKRRGGSP